MKEIGEKLKEARENIGITIEEAAEDLKLRSSQIENIEDGNMEAFHDVFYLKYFIRDYAKYLGLDYEEIVDEFNEYLFDYTSKISIQDIKKAQHKEHKKEDQKKIASPYTLFEQKQKMKQQRRIIIVCIGILLLGIAITVYLIKRPDQPVKEDNIVYQINK